MIVLDANIVSGRSTDKYNAVPALLATCFAWAAGNGSNAFLMLAPVAFVPGETAGRAPPFPLH
eukprot:11212952-Lingulodinium_polyedra.AAC.1